MTRYVVSRGGGSEVEVDRAAYVRAERDAGFRPKPGMDPDAPATASFHHDGPRGKLTGKVVPEAADLASPPPQGDDQVS